MWCCLQPGWPVMASGRGCRVCLDPVSLVPLLMALPLDQPLLLLLLPRAAPFLHFYALTDKWILAQKLGIPKIQFTDHMKLKKKEDQSVDT